MHRILDKLPFLKDAQLFFVSVISMFTAYFGTTASFVYAILVAFGFNILAGFKADEVRVKLWRLVNFNGHKFKDALKELFLILGVTYILKMLIDLMKHDDKSVYAVQILLALAVYFYFRNGLRNLSAVYPKNIWIKVIYHLVSFQFSAMMPSVVNKAIEKAESDENKSN